MKKITMILGMVAIAASALFVSCAKPNEIDPAMAFPRERAATYALDKKGTYKWTVASADQWTSGNKWTGFRVVSGNTLPELPGNAIAFYFAANKDWKASITEESKEYIKFRVRKNTSDEFYDEANWEYVDEVSGSRDNQIETQIFVTKTPEFGEESVVARIELTMLGQTMPLANITIGPAAEE